LSLSTASLERFNNDFYHIVSTAQSV